MLLNILQYILFKMRILSHFRNSGLDIIRMDNKKRTNGADMSGPVEVDCTEFCK